MHSIVKITLLIATCTAANIPSNFHKCSRKDENFKKCLLEAAQYGISQLTHPYPALRIPNVNPFYLPEARISGGNGPVGVDQIFKECSIFGLNTLQLDQFQIDFTKKTLELAGVIPEIRKLCNYEMKGKVLLLPVNGYGNSTITLKKLKVKDVLNFEEFPKNGKTYIKFVSSGLKMDPEFVHFDFMSAKDKDITNRLNPVLNENWKEIFEDVKGGYERIFDQIVISLSNGFFSQVSIEEAFN